MKRLIIVICVAFSQSVLAQHELVLHFADSISQSSFTNPAFRIQGGKSSYSMPNFSANFISPFAASQISTEKEGQRTLDFKKVFEAAQPVNRLWSNIELQTIGLTLGMNRFTLSFHNSIKGNANMSVSKDLIGGFTYGNARYLGKTMDLSSAFNASFHSELGLGGAYKFNEHLTVGGRVKLLSGLANVSTLKQNLTLQTDSVDYKITFNTDFDLRTSGFKTMDNFLKGNYVLGDIFISPNSGWSFDLGATYQIGKLRIDASIIDLGGSINWTNDVKTYTSKGQYVFTGSKSDDFFSFDKLDEEEVQDSLKAALNIKENSTGEIISKLPMKTYLGATYHISPKWRIGILMYTESWNNISQTDFAVNTTYSINKSWQFGATYAYRGGYYNNLGLQAVVKLGPVQLFGLTDNILGLMKTYESKAFNVRTGLNFLF